MHFSCFVLLIENQKRNNEVCFHPNASYNSKIVESQMHAALHAKKIMHVQKYKVFVFILKAWTCTEIYVLA